MSTVPILARPLRPNRALLLAALLLCPVTAGAQSPATALPAARERGAPAAADVPARLRFAAAIDSARAELLGLMERERIPGLSASVLVAGEVVWSEGFGLADIENGVRVTPVTRFRIGSVSKPVTAALLGLLVEQGRLDLDQPVQRYVPDFPRQQWPITTRQVAGHLAGIRHYRGDEALSSRRYPTVREGLSMFERDSLLHEPETRYHYSSYGFNLVSAVLEGAAEEPFLPLLRRHVFEPLALRTIVAEHQDSVITARARFYVRGAGGILVNAPYVDQSNKWAGGGFIANSEDLVRFAHAHLDDRLLRPETVRLLFTSQRTRDGSVTGYGLGWRSGRDSTAAWVGHTGGSVGGRAVLLLYPEHGATVAILANLGEAPMTYALAERILAPFVAANGGTATPE